MIIGGLQFKDFFLYQFAHFKILFYAIVKTFRSVIDKENMKTKKFYNKLMKYNYFNVGI